MSLPLERRQADRLSVDKPVKVQRASAARYDAARTLNVSSTGALIEIRSPRPLGAGERLALAIAPGAAVVLKSRAFVPARVVRTLPGAGTDGAQRVAIEFLRSAEQREPATLAA